MHACVLSHFNRVPLFETLWAEACQAPLSMRSSRQEYWGGVPCLPPEVIMGPHQFTKQLQPTTSSVLKHRKVFA